MASSLCQHQSNYDRVFDGSIYSETRRRGSTSQMCLHKILTIITTVPPPLAAATTKISPPENESIDEIEGFGFDLNVRLRISPKESVGAGASGMSSTSTAARRGGCLEIDLENGGDRLEIEENGHGVSENSDIVIEKTDKSLTLLIEAAKLIFGEFENDSVSRISELKRDEAAAEIEPELRGRSSRGTAPEIGGEFEETTSSPVVRSKRGRTQVLPGKYRDSVLEPLTRLSKRRRR